jgi:glycosyltransferase involved in cell wall biosynthesis
VVRFGIDARWLDAGPASGTRYVRGILRGISTLPSPPDLVLFTPSRAAASRGVAVRRLRRFPGPVFNGLAIQAALGSNVDAVLYQSFSPVWSRAGRAVVVHDLIYLRRPELFTPAERLYFSLIPMLLPAAEIVVTVSEHVRSQVLDRFPRRDASTVAVVPNGVDEAFFLDAVEREARIEAARRALHIDGPYVVAVGRVNPRKNLARLVMAMELANLAGAALVLAGPQDGPADPALRSALSSARRTRVMAVGHVPYEHLPGLYGGALAACYVSLDEGFGVPPLEAMAAGTPALVSDIPPLREVVGEAALRVDPQSVDAIADGLRTLVCDTAGRATWVSAGYGRAAKFHWSSAGAAAVASLSAAAALRSGANHGSRT